MSSLKTCGITLIATSSMHCPPTFLSLQCKLLRKIGCECHKLREQMIRDEALATARVLVLETAEYVMEKKKEGLCERLRMVAQAKADLPQVL